MRLTQHQEILMYIDEFGSITPMEAFSQLHITKLATRISEMRKDGMEFQIDTVKGFNKYGRPIRYARYSLPKEANNGI